MIKHYKISVTPKTFFGDALQKEFILPNDVNRIKSVCCFISGTNLDFCPVLRGSLSLSLNDKVFFQYFVMPLENYARTDFKTNSIKLYELCSVKNGSLLRASFTEMITQSEFDNNSELLLVGYILDIYLEFE